MIEARLHRSLISDFKLYDKNKGELSKIINSSIDNFDIKYNLHRQMLKRFLLNKRFKYEYPIEIFIHKANIQKLENDLEDIQKRSGESFDLDHLICFLVNSILAGLQTHEERRLSFYFCKNWKEDYFFEVLQNGGDPEKKSIFYDGE